MNRCYVGILLIVFMLAISGCSNVSKAKSDIVNAETKDGFTGSLIANDMETVTDKKIMYIATRTQGAYSVYNSAISAFNKKNSEYEIKQKQYSEEYPERIVQIEASLLAKDAPDIVEVLAGYSFDEYDRLVTKGYFENLLPYIESGTKVNRDLFIDRVFEDYIVDGKLIQIPDSFFLFTIACPTAALNGIDSWSIDEFMSFMEANPDAMSAWGNSVEQTKATILRTCLYGGIDRWVDFEGKGVIFDGESFAEVLNRINSLNIHAITSAADERCRQGEVVLWSPTVTCNRDVPDMEWKYGGDITFIGYPSSSENKRSGAIMYYNSGLSINANSSEKEAAWSFVESQIATSFINRENQFPTGKDALEQALMNGTEIKYKKNDDGSYVLDEEGNQVEEILYFEDRAPIKAITVEQVDKVRKAIDSAFVYHNGEWELANIILEEVQPFFAGEKTVEEVVQIIQSRAELFVDMR